MKMLLTLCCLIAALVGNAQADNILGTWLTESGTAKVEIGIGSGFYYGKIIWLLEPNDQATGKPRTDVHNPDATKQSLPLLGSVMLYGFKFDDNEYVGGNVYDAREGKTYSGKLWMENANTLSMRGYWGPFFKTEKWTRVQ